MKLSRLRISAAALLFTSGLGWWATRHKELPAPTPAGIGVTADNSRWEVLFDGKRPLAERLSRARRIDGSFPLPLLEAKTREFGPESAGQFAEHHFAIWNEIIGQCRRRNLQPGSLSVFLIGEIQNPALPPVIRDYAVQHLAHWICPGSPEHPGERENEKRRQGVELLCAIAGDGSVRGLSIPGTALLALSRNGKKPGL